MFNNQGNLILGGPGHLLQKGFEIWPTHTAVLGWLNCINRLFYWLLWENNIYRTDFSSKGNRKIPYTPKGELNAILNPFDLEVSTGSLALLKKCFRQSDTFYHCISVTNISFSFFSDICSKVYYHWSPPISEVKEIFSLISR